MGHLIGTAFTMNLMSILVFLVLEVSSEKSNLDDPVLFCDGCFALASEIEKDLAVNTGQTLKTRIETSLGAVCSTDRLRPGRR